MSDHHMGQDQKLNEILTECKLTNVILTDLRLKVAVLETKHEKLDLTVTEHAKRFDDDAKWKWLHPTISGFMVTLGHAIRGMFH